MVQKDTARGQGGHSPWSGWTPPVVGVDTARGLDGHRPWSGWTLPVVREEVRVVGVDVHSTGHSEPRDLEELGPLAQYLVSRSGSYVTSRVGQIYAYGFQLQQDLQQ